MKFRCECIVCHEAVWIRGSYDPSVNATELDENDRAWGEACEHIKEDGDYTITDEEPIDDEG